MPCSTSYRLAAATVAAEIGAMPYRRMRGRHWRIFWRADRAGALPSRPPPSRLQTSRSPRVPAMGGGALVVDLMVRPQAGRAAPSTGSAHGDGDRDGILPT